MRDWTWGDKEEKEASMTSRSRLGTGISGGLFTKILEEEWRGYGLGRVKGDKFNFGLVKCEMPVNSPRGCVLSE